MRGCGGPETERLQEPVLQPDNPSWGRDIPSLFRLCCSSGRSLLQLKKPRLGVLALLAKVREEVAELRSELRSTCLLA